jgi:TfoX/Sxy family transcriptional regulator of competence genes
MAHNRELEELIGQAVTGWENLETKRMFGGLCYLIRGNMCFGVHKDYLIVRTGPEVAEKKLNEKGVRPFDITGKAMKGWVMVEEAGWRKRPALDRWLGLGREYALTLPGNGSKP